MSLAADSDPLEQNEVLMPIKARILRVEHGNALSNSVDNNARLKDIWFGFVIYEAETSKRIKTIKVLFNGLAAVKTAIVNAQNPLLGKVIKCITTPWEVGDGVLKLLYDPNYPMVVLDYEEDMNEKNKTT